tara:strand:+ start:293 stop:691 length:399 start_codon:yes stop_codon:yes gene_type:complete
MDLGGEVGLLLKDFLAVIHFPHAVATRSLINQMLLTLYTRKGCCLCEGLEQRLENISLQKLVPPLILKVIDIDSDFITDDARKNLDLRVPVMVISLKEQNRDIELPRVSPRTSEEDLFKWMQKIINDIDYGI